MHFPRPPVRGFRLSSSPKDAFLAPQPLPCHSFVVTQREICLGTAISVAAGTTYGHTAQMPSEPSVRLALENAHKRETQWTNRVEWFEAGNRPGACEPMIIIECVCDPALLLLILLEGVAQEARRVQGPHGRPIAKRPLIGRGVGGPVQEMLLFLIESTNTIRLVMPLSATRTVDEHIAEALGAVVGDHDVSVVEGEEHSYSARRPLDMNSQCMQSFKVKVFMSDVSNIPYL